MTAVGFVPSEGIRAFAPYAVPRLPTPVDLFLGGNEGGVFLGRSMPTHQNVSESTLQRVDYGIRRIVDEQYQVARKLIEANRDKVEAMAKSLLEWETLDADQLNDIMSGLPPRPPKPPQSSQQPPQQGAPGAAEPAPAA